MSKTIQLTETLSITKTDDSVIITGPRTAANIAALNAHNAAQHEARSQELFDAKLAAYADAFTELDRDVRAKKMKAANQMTLVKSRKEEFADAVSELPFVNPVGTKRKTFAKWGNA